MRDVALTTIDNPFDPFDDFDRWYEYDIAAGHNTCELLDRFSTTSYWLGPELYEEQIEQAMDEIIKYDPFLKYKKVYKDI